MSDPTYIHILLDADSNWLSVRLSPRPYINMLYEAEDAAYVYIYRASDIILSEDNLKWSKLDGYLDPLDDPEYKKYLYHKEQLIERYGSIED
jgi:hypothetical protein